jgi:hypothetical protein
MSDWEAWMASRAKAGATSDAADLSAHKDPLPTSLPDAWSLISADGRATMRLPSAAVVGSGSCCDLRLTDEGVSTHHALLIVEDGLYVVPLSAAPTSIDGKIVHGRQQVPSGATLRFATVPFVARADKVEVDQVDPETGRARPSDRPVGRMRPYDDAAVMGVARDLERPDMDFGRPRVRDRDIEPGHRYPEDMDEPFDAESGRPDGGERIDMDFDRLRGRADLDRGRGDVTPIASARAAFGSDAEDYRPRVHEFPQPLRASDAVARRLRPRRRGRVGGILVAIVAAVALWWLSTGPWEMLTSDTASDAVTATSEAVTATRNAINERIDSIASPTATPDAAEASSPAAPAPVLVESTLEPVTHAKPAATDATPVPTSKSPSTTAPVTSSGAPPQAPATTPVPPQAAATTPVTAPASPQSTIAQPPTAQTANAGDARSVLLERADAMNAKGMLVTPARSNAAALYVSALTVDPTDAATRAKLDAIVTSTAQSASDSIARIKFDRARDLMDALATAIPERARQYVSPEAANRWRVVDLLLSADAKLQTYSINNAVALLKEAQRIDPRNPIADEMLAKAYGLKQQRERDAADADAR